MSKEPDRTIRALRSPLLRLPVVGDWLRRPGHRLGRRAENAVADLLRSRGYRILERNFRTRTGEIDIIAFRDGTVTFVEVRSRTDDPAHRIRQSVDRSKQKRILSAAHAYCNAAGSPHRHNVGWRFDVAAVTFDRGRRIRAMDYMEDAFRAER